MTPDSDGSTSSTEQMLFNKRQINEPCLLWSSSLTHPVCAALKYLTSLPPRSVLQVYHSNSLSLVLIKAQQNSLNLYSQIVRTSAL